MFSFLKKTIRRVVDGVKKFFSKAKNYVVENPVKTVVILSLSAVFGYWFFINAGPIAAYLGSKGWLGTASTGTDIDTLEGIALINASLAKIGFGSVAVGKIIISIVGGVFGFLIGYLVTKIFEKVKTKLERYNYGALLLN